MSVVRKVILNANLATLTVGSQINANLYNIRLSHIAEV